MTIVTVWGLLAFCKTIYYTEYGVTEYGVMKSNSSLLSFVPPSCMKVSNGKIAKTHFISSRNPLNINENLRNASNMALNDNTRGQPTSRSSSVASGRSISNTSFESKSSVEYPERMEAR